MLVQEEVYTENAEKNPILALINTQRAFFAKNNTKDVETRLKMLSKLRKVIENNESEICEALHQDFRKPAFEAYATEIAVTLDEIDYISKELKSWAKTRSVSSSLLNFPSQNYIIPEPLGVCLIIGAWNYPLQLTLAPLIGAIAAGNCAIVKPSELASASADVLEKIITETFNKEYANAYVAVVKGGVEVNQALLKEKFDKIFFTGSTAVGKIVMRAAAEHLTPVTLELGGKSPCIVAEDADLDLAAKRIAWGKFLNAGQTCVAPDYIVAHKNIRSLFIVKLGKYITEFYGENPQESPDYPRIINDRHFERLSKYLTSTTGTVVIGGKTDIVGRYIAPTVVDKVSWEDALMQDEIFGPILPVLEYENEDEMIAILKAKPKPLALYLFADNDKLEKKVLDNLSFGGACINDTISHLINPHLPFGGVGDSGMGAYHGKGSFDAFTHYKGVMKKANWLDIPLRYAPYLGKLAFIKQAFRWKP